MDAARLRPGVVGLGTIGGGLATTFALAGRHPSVFDVRPDAAAELPDDVVVASTPAEVAEHCDVVFVAVVDAPQVQTVLFGDGGICTGASTGVIVVVVSTIAISSLRAMADRARERGVTLVDAGVSGHPGAAAAGELVFLVGGPADDAAVVQRALDGCARSVRYLGPLGSGLVAKIARNVITYGAWRAVHEACELAEREGVDLHQLLDAVIESDATGTMHLILARARAAGVAADESRTSSMERMAALMDKDLAAAEELAVASATAVPLVNLTRREARDTLGLADGPGRSTS